MKKFPKFVLTIIFMLMLALTPAWAKTETDDRPIIRGRTLSTAQMQNGKWTLLFTDLESGKFYQLGKESAEPIQASFGGNDQVYYSSDKKIYRTHVTNRSNGGNLVVDGTYPSSDGGNRLVFIDTNKKLRLLNVSNGEYLATPGLPNCAEYTTPKINEFGYIIFMSTCSDSIYSLNLSTGELVSLPYGTLQADFVPGTTKIALVTNQYVNFYDPNGTDLGAGPYFHAQNFTACSENLFIGYTNAHIWYYNAFMNEGQFGIVGMGTVLDCAPVGTVGTTYQIWLTPSQKVDN